MLENKETTIGNYCDAFSAYQLPSYSDWLKELKKDLSSGSLQKSRISYHLEELASLTRPLVEQAKPAVRRLLSSLTDAQVRELAKNMAT